MYSSSCNYFFASSWADLSDYERQFCYRRSLHTIAVGEAQLWVLFDIPSIHYAICLNSI